jgi:hypothetical protein
MKLLITMHTKIFEDRLIKRYTRLSKSKSIKMLGTRIHTRAMAGKLALKVKVLTRESRRFSG